LTGHKGTLNTENEDIDITGNVVVKGKGYQLMTESLCYLHQDRMIVSAVPVMILGERLRLSGCGMQFDLNSGRFSLKEQVKLVYGLYGKEG
jgi:LPS export ABC transporter protein LptC